MNRLLVALVAVSPVFLATSASAADFQGPESCQGCHPEAYNVWKQSKHARAFDTLSATQQKDARCISCHAPDLNDKGVSAVTCETCHGGGQYYSTNFVMKDEELVRLVGLIDPSEKQCRTCHDAASPSLEPFEFVEKLKLIDHWTAERQRRAARLEEVKKLIAEDEAARAEEAAARKKKKRP